MAFLTKRISSEMEQLSGVMIIIIIGGGVLTFVMLFIFAKRQIMRFSLRNRRGPHVPIGNDAKKALRREIERRLECLQKIAQEPKLLWDDDKFILQKEDFLTPYYYRMKAVDNVKILEREIQRNDGSVRHANDSLRAFLVSTLTPALNGINQRLIHQFCDMYEHARHDPNEFGSEEYENYHRLQLQLIEAAKQLKSLTNSRKSSPARTPKKNLKVPSLLDPSRLRPPTLGEAVKSGISSIPASSELTAGQHSKVNLTLGLQGQNMDTSDIPQNPLHLQPPGERDAIIRNRIKTPTLDDVDYNDVIITTDADLDNEIMSISTKFHDKNSSVV